MLAALCCVCPSSCLNEAGKDHICTRDTCSVMKWVLLDHPGWPAKPFNDSGGFPTAMTLIPVLK